MANVLGTGQFTILDINDAIISGTAPSSPTIGTLWIDNSLTPNVLKSWNGSTWIPQNLSLEGLDPNASQDLVDATITLASLAADNQITKIERSYIKDKITAIIGIILGDTSSMPTLASIDAGTAGEASSVRKEAVIAGIATDHASYIAVGTEYTNLSTYLNAMSPKPWDTASATVITMVSSDWRDKWTKYYEAVLALRQAISNKLREAVDDITVEGRNLIPNSVGILGLWNGTTDGVTDNKNGLKVTTATTSEKTASSIRFKVEPNTNYTVSAWVKTSANCKGVDVFFLSRKPDSVLDYDYLNLPIGNKISTAGLTFYSGMFTTKVDEVEGYIRIDNNGSTDGLNADATFCLLKMENGVDATGWVEADVDDVERLRQTAESIRDDLNLTSPLPTSIIQNSDGITAMSPSDPNVFARLDYRGIYIQGGAIQIDGGLPSTQLSTTVQNNIAAGVTAKTEADQDNGLNQWVRRTYNMTNAVNTIPAYSHIQAKTPNTETLVTDAATLASGIGDNYIGLLKTAVYVDIAKTISFTLTHDDGAQIYLNGKSVYTKNAYTQNAPVSLSLNIGWNTIDIMWAEQLSGDGITAVTPLISTLVDKMSAYYAGDRGQLINIETIAGNSVQQDVSYSTVKISSSGLIAQRTDNKSKTTLDGNGFKIEKSPDNGVTWTRQLYVESDGTVYANGLVIDGTMGSNLASKDYVQSRGENLITNGTGLLNNNTNFLQFVFNKTELYSGGGSFTITGRSATPTHEEFIAVDISKNYKFSYAIKELEPYNVNGRPNFYSMINSYDIDKNAIFPAHYETVSGSAKTTLAVALNPGDTVIRLTNSTGWHNSTTDHMRQIRFHGYVNSQGYIYPDYTYSRWVHSQKWAAGGIDYATNTITLITPWAGPAYPAGQLVANAQDGGTYIYPGQVNLITPRTWTKYDSIVTPSMFRPGTAFIKAGWLVNRDVSSGNTTTAFSAVTFEIETIETGSTYNGVKIDAASGIKVTSAKNVLTMNATSGLLLEKTDGTDIFALDSNGNLSLTGNITMTAGSSLNASYINAGIMSTDRLGANSISATKIAIGDFTNAVTVNENNSASMLPSGWQYGQTVIDTGYVKKAVATNPYLMMCDFTQNNLRQNDELYYEFEAYAPVGGNATLRLWTYNALYSGGNTGSTTGITIPITTINTKFTGSIVLPSPFDTSMSYLIGFDTVSTVDIRVKKMIVRKKHNGSMLVNGSIVASHISSLNGLNAAGGNFVIDANGNVTVKGTLQLNGTSTIGSSNSAVDTVVGNATKGATAYGLRTKGIGLKPNYSAFAVANAGEAYIHGYDENGNAADLDGFLVVNGNNVTVPRQMLNPDAVVNGYITYDQGLNKWYVSYPQNDGTWYRVDAGITAGTFTPTISHYFCGTLKTTSAESVVEATLWNDYKDYLEMATYLNVVVARYTVDNLSVGGRNILKESKLFPVPAFPEAGAVITTATENGESYTRIANGITANGDAYAWVETYLSRTFELNKDYIISADIRTDDTSFMFGIRNENAVGDEIFYPVRTDITANTWKRIVQNFKFTRASTQYLIAAGAKAANKFIDVKNIKIEEGNRATAWSPAPEDIYDDLRMPAGEYLPNSITMDRNGITAKTDVDANAYARLDNRGLFVAKGAVQIDTGTGVGVKLDGTNGITVTSTGSTVTFNATKGMEIKRNSDSASMFSVDTSGNIKMTGDITMTKGSITWGTGANAVTPPTASDVGATTPTYVQSRSDNIITNGNGSVGNTNFTSFTYDAANNSGSVGSFYTALQNGTLYNDEYIPVNTNEIYRLSVIAKSSLAKGSCSIGLIAYTATKTVIAGGNIYMCALNKIIPAQWTQYAATIGNVNMGADYQFPIGTAYVKLVFLVNWNTNGGLAGDALWFTNVELYSGTKQSDFNSENITAKIIGSENSLALISEHIDLTGKVSFTSLSPDLTTGLFIEEDGVTLINGAAIKTGTIEAKNAIFYDMAIQARTLVDGALTATGKNVFTIDNSGNVDIAGTVKSINYIEKAQGWAINRDGTAEFNAAVFRGNVEVGYYDDVAEAYVPTAGLLSGGTGVKELRFWAGTDSNTAAFKVFSDGSLEATKGTFTGTFQGKVEVGNIVITDTDIAGDASMTLSDSSGNQKFILNETLSNFNVPTTFGNAGSQFLKIDSATKKLEFGTGDFIIDYTNNLFKMKDYQFKGGSSMQFISSGTGTNDFEFSNSAGETNVYIDGALQVETAVSMGTAITIRKSVEVNNKGVDFVFI